MRHYTEKLDTIVLCLLCSNHYNNVIARLSYIILPNKINLSAGVHVLPLFCIHLLPCFCYQNNESKRITSEYSVLYPKLLNYQCLT